MKINRRLSKKKTMAVVISALIGIGTSGMAYSAKTDPATTEKGGSFTYITPAGGLLVNAQVLMNLLRSPL